MTATASEASSSETASSTATAPIPKRITNAQTVCNEKNAKGKLCNGHLKQLRTAAEPSEVHLRGDDVLSKCQTCGTYYMGPPLGHVRDPHKQSRFVEAELSALLQAAGGSLPVIKKDARGVFIMETTGHAPAAAKPAPAQAASAPVAKAAAPAVAAKPTAAAPGSATPKAGAEPDRKLNKRSTYAGVIDTGPVPGETFEQKVARLQAVAAAAKQRAEEGGDQTAPAAASAPDSPVVAAVLESAMTLPLETETTEGAAAPASVSAPTAPAATAEHKPTGQADRTLMLRSTYCGVVDTGPVPGETFEQKVERLRAVAAAAKQRADGG
jgi:hypothetical protein